MPFLSDTSGKNVVFAVSGWEIVVNAGIIKKLDQGYNKCRFNEVSNGEIYFNEG